MITDDELAKILVPSGVIPDSRLFSSIRDYIALLLQWNRKISLTSLSSFEEIVRFHFGESFFAATAIPLSSGRLADVGSGAGFPGIPLKMLSPDLHLSLIESNAKKAAFLGEVLRKLKLQSGEVLQTRMEGIRDDVLRCDFITARALGKHRDLMKWARRHLSDTGKLILFLGGEDAYEISIDSSWTWKTIPIPGTRNRVLLEGSPK